MERRMLHVTLNERRIRFQEEFRKTWLIVLFGVLLFIAGVFVLLNNEVVKIIQISKSSLLYFTETSCLRSFCLSLSLSHFFLK